MHEGFSLPQSSWIALLSIAHRYEFLDVRERAIREIYGALLKQPDAPWQSPEQLDQDHPLLISVGEKYDVPPRHVLRSLIAIVVRDQPLTADEITRFSPVTVSRLAHAREDYARKTAKLPEYIERSDKPSEYLRWTYGVASNVVYKIWPIQNDG
jgi:hypothetical protein